MKKRTCRSGSVSSCSHRFPHKNREQCFFTITCEFGKDLFAHRQIFEAQFVYLILFHNSTPFLFTDRQPNRRFFDRSYHIKLGNILFNGLVTLAIGVDAVGKPFRTLTIVPLRKFICGYS